MPESFASIPVLNWTRLRGGALVAPLDPERELRIAAHVAHTHEDVRDARLSAAIGVYDLAMVDRADDEARVHPLGAFPSEAEARRYAARWVGDEG